MLRIHPIGHASLDPPPYAPVVEAGALLALAAAPWHCEVSVGPGCDPVANDGSYACRHAYQYPLQHVSSALTIENALWQRNLLLQAGIGYEHVGMLVVYGQYSAKGASLQAVMPAVWASAEYAKLVEEKRSQLNLP